MKKGDIQFCLTFNFNICSIPMKQINLSLLVLIIFLNLFLSIKGQDARLIAKNTFPSIVMLEMRDDKDKPIALGSGFFVRPDIIATNYHVIEGSSVGFAKIVGKPSTYQVEGVVGFDKKKDLALLKLKGVVGKPLVLADISKIEVGQEIFALGNPKGLEGTISPGIISGSSLREVGDENLIQITAPISPGSSGGPVVNRKGEVIGVAVASLSGGQNLNFAIPSSDLALLLANLKSVNSISETKRETPKYTTNSGPTLAETTAWITNKLKEERERFVNGEFQTIIDSSFDHCKMYLLISRRNSSINYSLYSAHLGTLDSITGGKHLVMLFSKDAVRIKNEEYSGKTLLRTFNYKSSVVIFWVEDEEIGTRIAKAFEHLKNLCKDDKEETNKEPF